jgi:cell wall-associated NlpC family hydrolase
MARTAGVSGPAVGLATVGGLLIYAAITDKNPLDAIRELASGKSSKAAPFAKPEAFGITGGIGGGDFGTAGASSSALLNSAMKYLGRPYKWGGTFKPPDIQGDCSGLVYRAGVDIGLQWPRFTTTTIMFSSFVQKVSAPSPGDLVVWPGHHMGIVSGPGQMINAPHRGTVVRYDSWSPRRNGVMAVYLRVKSNVQAGTSGSLRGGP